MGKVAWDEDEAEGEFEQPKTGLSRGSQGLLGCDKGVLLDGVQHIQELDLGGERVAVVDDRKIIRAIPAVH